MTREEKITVVESYIYGLGHGDFAHVPFADDVSYESPLTPKRSGKDAIDFLAALFPIMRGAEIQQHIVEGDYVATVFHLRTPNGVTAVFDKFRVVDGKLKEINPYYDPSILKEAVQQLYCCTVNHTLQRTGGPRCVAALRFRQRFGVVLPPPLSFCVEAVEKVTWLPHQSS